MQTWVHAHVCVYVYVRACPCVHGRACLCVCVCVCVCDYIIMRKQFTNEEYLIIKSYLFYLFFSSQILLCCFWWGFFSKRLIENCARSFRRLSWSFQHTSIRLFFFFFFVEFQIWLINGSCVLFLELLTVLSNWTFLIKKVAIKLILSQSQRKSYNQT